MIVKGQFVSIWDFGIISTNCTLNSKTGKLDPVIVGVKDSLGSLIEEDFEDRDGRRYNVCSVCHEYITDQMLKHDRCLNKECESNKT